MKRVIMLFLGLVILASFSLPVFAVDGDFVLAGTELVGYTGNGGDVVIPDGTESIEESLFSDMSEYSNITKISRLTLPASLINLGSLRVFKGCTSLNYITVKNGNTYYSSVDGVLFNADKSVLVQFPQVHSLSEYSVPSGIKQIDSLAFQDCKKLTVITLPSSVKTLSIGAFYNCVNLSKIIIPSSVTKIEDDWDEDNEENMAVWEEVFENCKKLTIYGNNGSYAQTYAKRKNIPFVVMDNTTTSKNSTSSVTATGNTAIEKTSGTKSITTTASNSETTRSIATNNENVLTESGLISDTNANIITGSGSQSESETSSEKKDNPAMPFVVAGAAVLSAAGTGIFVFRKRLFANKF